MIEFAPHPWLKNSHAMTILPALNPFAYSALAGGEDIYVDVAEDSKILIHLHVGTDRHAPTLVLVHGLEGSGASPYILSLARKARALGMNAVRVNLRNCGGTLHLSPTLYNGGLSSDILALVKFLRTKKGLSRIFLVGYSLGGNIVLKTAAELARNASGVIDGVCTVSPSMDLKAAVETMQFGLNRFYDARFVHCLKRKVWQKAKLFPGRYDVEKLKKVKTLRSFDEMFTAPDAGYGSADEYYALASSLRVAEAIATPTLIITAQDDPIVPFHSFSSPKLKSEFITLLAPKYGGHGGFIHRELEVSDAGNRGDRLWAENRILDFCRGKSC